MKNCPECGCALTGRKPSRTKLVQMVEQLREGFEIDKLGTVEVRRMTAVNIANVLGIPPVQSAIVLIGRAAGVLGLKNGRSGAQRWIEMPPARSDDVFL